MADASTFAVPEIAGLLIAVGTGKPLRDCAHDMREEALRRHCAPNAGRARRKLEPRQGELPDATAELAARPIRPVARPLSGGRRGDAGCAAEYNYSAPKRRRRVDASRSASVAMDYVDQYGPVVLRDAAPDRWPLYVALGSVPLPRRGRPAATERTSQGRGAASAPECRACGPDRGEIIVAADCELPGNEYPFHARLAGGTDRDSWLEFLTSLAGRPTWIAASWHQGLADAVSELWPDTILFASEDRLRDELRAAARRDGVPEPRPDRGPLFDEIRGAFRDEDHWRALVVSANALAPARASELRAWIDDNEPLVLEQLVRKRGFRRAPFTDAPVRSALDAIRTQLLPYARTMRNMWRINLRLALMCAHWSGLDQELEYVAALNRHFATASLERTENARAGARGRSGGARPDWASGRDFGGARSIDDYLAAASERRRRTHEADHGGLLVPHALAEPRAFDPPSIDGSMPKGVVRWLRSGDLDCGPRQTGSATTQSAHAARQDAPRILERARSWPKARRTRFERPGDRRLRVIPDAQARAGSN